MKGAKPFRDGRTRRGTGCPRWFLRRTLLAWLGIAALSVLPAATCAEPLLGIAINESASGGYESAVQQARRAGAQFTTLTLFWDELESGGPDWPAIANAFYPSLDMGLLVVFPVIDTVADRRPKDLRRLKWSDPGVMTRFDAFLSDALQRMPDVRLVGIAIGNEVDGVLSGRKWDDFAVFFEHARRTAQRLRPGSPVGVTVQWSALEREARARALADRGDVWMVNHYPLGRGFRMLPNSGIEDRLADMVRAARGKPVWLTETGYSSGGCNGSPEKQQEYLEALFRSADKLGSRLPLVNLVWLHDISRAELRRYKSYYGVSSDCFARYLGTLGLRNRDGTDKPAFAWLTSR